MKCPHYVLDVPEILERPTDLEVQEGDAFRLRCTVSDAVRPLTTVWWLHNARPVSLNRFIHVSGEHTVLNGNNVNRSNDF